MSDLPSRELYQAATGDTPNRPYFMIVNRATGKALDLISGNTNDGALINQWSYDYNGGNQRWTLVPTGNGHHHIISWVSGRSACIQVASS